MLGAEREHSLYAIDPIPSLERAVPRAYPRFMLGIFFPTAWKIHIFLSLAKVPAAAVTLGAIKQSECVSVMLYFFSRPLPMLLLYRWRV